MKIYDAIRKMHELTEKGETFSISFMRYSYEKDISDGPTACEHALLLPPNRKEHNKYAEHMRRYRDMDTYEEKMFWIPLLLEFNHERVEF